MVHTLQSDDSRLFRCDVLGEVVQWNVDTDRSAIEFVLGLHDMWSRVIAEKPWWIGESVVTIPEGDATATTMRRRLQEEGEEDVEEKQEASGDPDELEQGEEEESGDEEVEEAESDIVNANAAPDEDDVVETVTDTDGDEEDGVPAFDMKGEDGEEVAAGDKARGDSSDRDDDQVPETKDEELQVPAAEERDLSFYDTWMGVLSANSVKYFVRIVSSAEVGVVSLEDYDKSRSEQ